MLKTFEINLDLENEIYSPSQILFTVSSLDTDSIEFQFIVSQDLGRLDLTGKQVKLAIKKPSGLTVFEECEITNATEGKAACKISIQSYIEFGIHKGELYILNANQIGVTSQFYYMSREAIMDGETIESTNDWSALQQALFSYDKRPIIFEGIPTTIPEYIGQTALDIIGKRAFIAYGETAESWQLLGAGEGGGGIISWADIIGKPTAFTPEIHTHDFVDIQGKPATYPAEAHLHEWIEIEGKPATFPPDVHNHGILDVTGLQAALDSKADSGELGAPAEHTHAILDVTGLQAALDSKADDADLAGFAPAAHSHAFADITGKPATYPPDVHVHPVSDVTGLQAALDGKADDADLAAKANAADVYLKVETYTKTEVDAIATGITQGGGTIVQDNLISTSTTAALSANQGRVLDEGKADVTHNHDTDYAGINHNHPINGVEGLQAALDAKADDSDLTGKADAIHNHSIAEVTGLQVALDAKADDADLAAKADAVHSHTFAEITAKPTTYPPDVHGHGWTEITGKPATFPPDVHTHAYADITGKPATFAPDAHNHAILDVTGLQAALDGKADDADLAAKADAAHSHAFADITGKPATFAPDAHNHAIAEVTGLQIALDAKADDADLAGKADAVHTHAYADITGKPATFPAEAHAHAIADVTGLQGALDSKIDATYADAGDNFIMNTVLAGLKLWKGTQAEYDAIGTKDTNTLYFITG